jgi:hypothetical protein
MTDREIDVKLNPFGAIKVASQATTSGEAAAPSSQPPSSGQSTNGTNRMSKFFGGIGRHFTERASRTFREHSNNPNVQELLSDLQSECDRVHAQARTIAETLSSANRSPRPDHPKVPSQDGGNRPASSLPDQPPPPRRGDATPFSVETISSREEAAELAEELHTLFDEDKDSLLDLEHSIRDGLVFGKRDAFNAEYGSLLGNIHDFSQRTGFQLLLAQLHEQRKSSAPSGPEPEGDVPPQQSASAEPSPAGNAEPDRVPSNNPRPFLAVKDIKSSTDATRVVAQLETYFEGDKALIENLASSIRHALQTGAGEERDLFNIEYGNMLGDINDGDLRRGFAKLLQELQKSAKAN